MPRTHFGNRGNWTDPPTRPPQFPHADSQRLVDAPDRCPRCQGPWHRVDEGYACVTCGKRWRVAECLAASLGRPFAHATAPARVRINTLGGG